MQEIPVQCRCGQQFAADAGRAGQTLACPYCSSPLHIPVPVPPAACPPGEVWHGRLADGQVFGPVSRVQLDEAAAAGQFTADDELWLQGDLAPMRAADLYPHLWPAPPLVTKPAATSTWSGKVQQDLDHLASNPIGYLLSGPKRAKYQHQQVGAAWLAIYVMLLLFLAGAGTVLLGIFGVACLSRGDDETAGLAALLLLVLFGGIFTLAGSLFQWRFFFESRKAIGMRDLLGDGGARYAYIVLGAVFVIVAFMVPTFSLVGNFRQQGVAEQKKQGMELQVRTWTIKQGGRVEVFQGKLNQLSGTGATVTRDGQIVGAKFADFSPADREYLREVFRSRGEYHFARALYEEYDVAFDAPNSPPGNNVASTANATSGAPSSRPFPLGGVKVGVPELPDPQPGFNRPPPIDPALPLKQPLIEEPLNVGKTDELLIAGINVPRAFALERGLRETQLRTFDLRDGTMLKQYLLPHDSKLVAVAPDGSRVVLAEERFLTKNFLAMGLGEEAIVEAKWQPHADVNPEWITFATRDRLFSGTSRYSQKSWPWPPTRVLNEFESTHRYEFTPGGRFFIERVLAGLQFRNTSDGRLAGALRFESGLSASALAVSRDGTRLIAQIRRESSIEQLLGCWDLTTGSRLFLVQMGSAAGSYRTAGFFHWLGQDYVLCGNLLFSMKEQQVVWRFTRTPSCLKSPDHRLWTTAKYGNETQLTPQTIPDAELLAKLEVSGRPQPIVNAGDKVNLEFDFQAAPPSTEMRSRLRATVEQKMREAGWQVVGGQAQKVKVVIGEKDEGGTLLFGVVTQSKTRYSGHTFEKPTGETIDVPNRLLTCTFDMIDQRGDPWRLAEYKYGPRQVPEQELALFQKFTPEMVLGKRWDVLAKNLDYSLKFYSESWSFTKLGESALTVSVTPEFMAKQAEIRRAEQLAEIESRKPKIDLPWEPEKVPWRVEPDPHPALMASALRRTMPIAEGVVKGIRFAPAAGQVIVHMQVYGEIGKTSVHRIALREKKLLARTPLPTLDAKLLDFRPDGQVWLVQPTPKENTLQVWQCVDEGDRQLVELKLTDERAIQQAFFVGRGGLLVNDGEKLVARKLPKGELVFQHELSQRACHLSWGRKYFVDWSGSRLALYQTADGTLAGQLAPLPSGRGQTRSINLRDERDLSSAAFHPDGRQLAALVGTTIGIWNLEDGSLLNWIDIPLGAKAIRWCSPTHLLVDDKLLDLEWEAPIWSYPKFLSESPDGRGWFFAADQRDMVHLAAIALPSEFVLEPLGKIKERVPPLLQPNQGVSLRISASGDAERHDELVERLTQLFTEQLSAKKIDVRDGEGHMLSISYNITTHARDAYRLERDDSELIVENRLLEAHIVFSRGSSKWEKKLTVVLPAVDYVLDPASDDPARDLLKQQEDRMFDLLRRVSPPTSLPPLGWSLFGRSECGISGEEVSLSPSYRF